MTSLTAQKNLILSNRSNYFLFFCLSLGLFLRLCYLGADSFWFDEGMDLLHISTTGLKLRNIMQTPYLNIIFQYYWRFLGNSEFMLRLPSAISSTVSIAVIYFFTTLLFNKKAGLITAFILTMSPLHIHYAQESRPYALSCLMLILAGYFFVKSLNKSRKIYWFFFASFSLLGVYAHYTSIFMLCAYNIFFLRNIKKYYGLRVKWYITNGLILLLLFPAVKLFSLSPYYYMKYWWLPEVSYYTILITFTNFSIGYNAPFMVYMVASFLFFLCFAYGVWHTKDKVYLSFLILGIFLPVGVIFITSFLKPALFYVDRYFLPSSVFFYILVARGVSAIKNNFLQYTIIFIIFICSAISIKNHYVNYFPNTLVHHRGIQIYKDTRGLANYIRNNFQNADKICFIEENMIPQLRYYFSRHYLKSDYKKEIHAQFTEEKSFRGFLEPDKQIILKYNPKTRKTAAFFFDMTATLAQYSPTTISLNTYKRMWLITPPNSNVSRIVAHLDRKLVFLGCNKFEGAWVYLFSIAE